MLLALAPKGNTLFLFQVSISLRLHSSRRLADVSVSFDLLPVFPCHLGALMGPRPASR